MGLCVDVSMLEDRLAQLEDKLMDTEELLATADRECDEWEDAAEHLWRALYKRDPEKAENMKGFHPVLVGIS